MTDTIGNQKNETNKPIDYPMNILEFQKMFPDEIACIQYLERMRWPDGFCCGKCSQVGEPFKFSRRPRILRCKACHDETSITANTVMHRSKTDILVWFWAAHLVATQTPGVSALELQKKLGIGAPRKRHYAHGCKYRRESADPAHFVSSLGSTAVMQWIKRRQEKLQAVSAS